MIRRRLPIPGGRNGGRHIHADARLADRLASLARRGRHRLSRLRRLRSAVNLLRRVPMALRRAQSGESAPPVPAPPRERREAVWTHLAPHLADADLVVVRDTPAVGATIAIHSGDLSALHAALVRAGSARHDLQVRLCRQTRTLKSLPLASLTQRDLASADWLQIGSRQEVGHYPVGLDGYLTVLFVGWDSERHRYLALNTRAHRVDWTELFHAADGVERPTTPITVGSREPHVSAPLDVVYTWVDSSDPTWRERYSRYSGEHVVHNASADNDERYLDRDELRYSLRSVWMFAPFVRHIYIVTADQRPDWLQPHPKITLVSHQDIFPDPCVLPTFNSHAIEACLHRITGLSENFLYFNDDVFLGRETDESDFFTLAGLAKARLSATAFIYEGEPEHSAIPTDWAAYNSVSLLDRDFAIPFRRRLQHVPFALKRSVLEEIESRYPKQVEQTRSHRFRDTSDVAIPSMLAQYFAIATHRAVEWPGTPGEYVYLNTGRTSAADQYQSILDNRPPFFCLNVTRDNEIDLEEQGRQLTNFMESAFPIEAPWEREARTL